MVLLYAIRLYKHPDSIPVLNCYRACTKNFETVGRFPCQQFDKYANISKYAGFPIFHFESFYCASKTSCYSGNG